MISAFWFLVTGFSPVAIASDSNIYARPMQEIRSKKVICSKYDLFQSIENSQNNNCLDQAIKHMDVNARNIDGDSPLHFAIRKNNPAAIYYLVKHGADLNSLDFYGDKPSILAERLGHWQWAKVFKMIELENSRLFEAVDNNDLNAVSSSLARGARVLATNTRKDTPLHKAAQSNLPEMAQYLISKGANVNSKNYLGESPLHQASMRNFHKVAAVLLRNGANPSMQDERRRTPLDLAQINGGIETERLLNRQGALAGVSASVSLDIEIDNGQIDVGLNSGSLQR